MCKKIIFSLLIVIALFMITGCRSNVSESVVNSDTKSTISDKADGEENNVSDLSFIYDGEGMIEDTANGKRMQYDNYSIIVAVQKDKNIDTIVKEKNITYNSAKTINKLKWQVYDFSANVVSTIYMIEKENDTYNVTFVHDTEKEVNLDNVIDKFMNSVSFK